MKTFVALLAVCAAALAQSNPLTEAVKARYQGMKQNLVETADLFPDADYDYKLTPAQRTFGEWIGHTALATYSACAGIKGEKVPEAAQKAAKAHSKAEASKALREAFAYCDASLEGMTDAKAMAAIDLGGKPVYPAQGMVALIANTNEHYGNLVGYVRSKGMVPPSTARAAKKK
jgi:hypothetical protein